MSNPPVDPVPQRDTASEVPPFSSSQGQGTDDSAFWRHKSSDELAAEQGVQPIEDFEAFLDEIGDVWPEEESADEFIAWLRKLRREGRDS
ncbi:MAG TPA: hypothetical protein VN688_03080 [Gemmataceae bacterium]|nr:hypothetical protein [Gemmataceae bacterium]